MIERYQRVDRALVAAAEMHATGTRKVQRVAEKMGVSRLPKDRWAPSRRAWKPTSRSSVQGRSTAPQCPTSGSTRPTSSAAVVTASAATWAAGGASWASTWWTPSRKTRGSPSCWPSARAGRRACGSPSRKPARDSSARSTRSSRAPRGSAARSTSCATACVRPAPSSSGAAWAGSSHGCSAGATPPP